MTLETILFRGTVNKELLVKFIYQYTQDLPYPTIKTKGPDKYIITPSFGIAISEGYNKRKMFITTNMYPGFISLLSKSIELISNHFYELFPNTNKIEFDVDHSILQRFQTEKAISVMDMIIMPDVWVDATSACYPAIKVERFGETLVIPYEDALLINTIFKRFDPYGYSGTMLSIVLND